MIGTLDPSKKDVTIVGAGIAGLLLAHRLDQLGYEVTLLEASPRAGGLLHTEKGGFGIAEVAAHSILVSPAVEALMGELGVPLVPVREKARYVFRRGKPRKFPLTLSEALVALFKSYFVLADKSFHPGEETLERWSLRHLGKGALAYLLTPFVRGIYGAEPDELRVGAAFPALKVEWGNSLVSQLVSRWRRNRSKRKRPVMMAPQNGMGQLALALEARLKERLGARFRLEFPVERLPHAGNIVIATPAAQAARLVAQAETPLAQALGRVRYSPLVSATVFVEASRVPRRVRGVGVLVPKVEGRDTLGILFNSSAFAGRVTDESLASFTVMLGGTARPEMLKLGDDEIRSVLERDLFELLGISGGIKNIVIHRHERAVPLYDAELVDAWEIARQTWCAKPGRILFGNYTGQVSVRGMIESVSQLG